MVTTRNVGSHQFNFVGVVEPALDDTGRIVEYMHTLHSKVRPNRYAGGPFCRFRLNGAPTRSGVYAITAADDLQYIGGYPGGNHRMPVCCQVMKAAIQGRDKVVEIPPRGAGANLIVEYVLPRPA